MCWIYWWILWNGAQVTVITGPLGLTAILVGTIGGIVAGTTARYITDKVTDRLIQDTQEELDELENEARKLKYKQLYKEALKNLGCLESSSDEEIKKARDRLAKAHHPDRWPIEKHGREKSEEEAQKFVKYWAYWTIIKDYRAGGEGGDAQVVDVNRGSSLTF
eukprot:TRINITY_DN16102_c0_g1_i1.p1 TRINITY_DN16102_c0_g1~~TRINITY_DN16102_c0_g1_i1.p1  ORF type:complete len:163 (-),score=27.12 TRINITY_DN16102_c0_g1_i1:28-516(-)